MKITLVSYFNTLPFIEGLKWMPRDVEIIKRTPALCAQYFREGQSDIALLPVGSLYSLPPYQIVTDFCIGCDGAVRTVVLMSNVPLQDITTIYLDEDSRTSAKLVRVLAQELSQQNISYINGIPTFPNAIKEGEALLMIGDKVFDFEGHFTYTYDLGLLWKEVTGLPFVFAVWVAKLGITGDDIQVLNNGLQKGIANLEKINWSLYGQNDIDLNAYLTQNISYSLDDDKRKAMRVFIDRTDKLIS